MAAGGLKSRVWEVIILALRTLENGIDRGEFDDMIFAAIVS
jgi:hypothetical protein